MVALAHSAALVGVDARAIDVEVELADGLPVLAIIGLGDAAVHEAKYRVQSAIRAASIELPHKRVTINLAPADLRKDGASLDLPMALALLAAAGHVPPDSLDSCLALGELALNGALRPIRGALAASALARAHGYSTVIVPPANADEAAAIPESTVFAPQNFADLVAHLRGEALLCPHRMRPSSPPVRSKLDLADVRGQPLARRALEVAAAGGHNLLMVGPPGSGKTMLARRLPGLMPPLTIEESLEVTRVWSAAGLTIGGGIVETRPFRAPHHTLSEAALVGGGSPIRPGEVSLAHQGVLFLDELFEVPRRVIESLRVPLEDQEISIARVRQHARMPARFMLVGAANPCPCGWSGDPSGRCDCDPERVRRYFSRVSGPILDRIDLVVEVPAVPASDLIHGARGESSADVARRVIAARALARTRGVSANAQLDGQTLREAANLHRDADLLLEKAVDKMGLSARAVQRALKVSRTIADLEGAQRVPLAAIGEALRYRPVGNLARKEI